MCIIGMNQAGGKSDDAEEGAIAGTKALSIKEIMS